MDHRNFQNPHAEAADVISNGYGDLWLLHLSDSALPIGSTAHSFGLEAMVESGQLVVDELEDFLADYLSETGFLDAVFCAAAHDLSKLDGASFSDEWITLGAKASAFRPSRECRVASATLGRRFLSLVMEMTQSSQIENVLAISRSAPIEIHHCTAFGLACGLLNIGKQASVRGYLHQLAASMISSCQRLMPVGQVLASKILWNLKKQIVAISESCVPQGLENIELAAFSVSVDMAAMRHPNLRTRLFIS